MASAQSRSTDAEDVLAYVDDYLTALTRTGHLAEREEIREEMAALLKTASDRARCTHPDEYVSTDYERGNPQRLAALINDAEAADETTLSTHDAICTNCGAALTTTVSVDYEVAE